MFVLATAGHVDHGKSTLVRALTGTDPDRLAEEKRRGLTLDLGFAWTTLPTGEQIAFVDVPGHQRFIATMLAGLGPGPAVVLVVAADEGWRRQSGEHLAAIDALDVRHGLLVITRRDRADPAPALAQARTYLERSSIAAAEAVAVSSTTGEGFDELRAALGRLVHGLPAPDPSARIRLWVDRSFAVSGRGTVVTATLAAGTIAAGDTLELRGQRVTVRGLQQTGAAVERATAVARVALNLRGIASDEVGRGDVLLAPGRWPECAVVDVGLSSEVNAEQFVLHVGTAAVAVRVRPLAGRSARLTLSRALPLQPGDRAVLRDPGRQTVAAGVLVLDVDPPALQRRGAARRRGIELRAGPPDLLAQVARRGALRTADALRLGLAPDAPGLIVRGDWLIDPARWSVWVSALSAAVDATSGLLEPGLSDAAAVRAAGLPDPALLTEVAEAGGLIAQHGRIVRPGATPDLGAALQQLEQRLLEHDFDSPELSEITLTRREVAAAIRAGRLIDLGGVLLRPAAPQLARAILAGLQQPFTASQARQALATTRRVVIPLLEHLDAIGLTQRIDAGHRRVL